MGSIRAAPPPRLRRRRPRVRDEVARRPAREPPVRRSRRGAGSRGRPAHGRLQGRQHLRGPAGVIGTHPRRRASDIVPRRRRERIGLRRHAQDVGTSVLGEVMRPRRNDAPTRCPRLRRAGRRQGRRPPADSQDARAGAAFLVCDVLVREPDQRGGRRSRPSSSTSTARGPTTRS